MKILCLLLLFALARPPRQGELTSQAVLVLVEGLPNLRFTFQSRAREPIEFGLPAGTPLRSLTGEGEPVFLGAPLQVKLRPAERAQFTVPVLCVQTPSQGVYQPVASQTYRPQATRVHQVISAGESRELAGFALLPAEQQPPEVQSRLRSFQFPPLPSPAGLTGVELTGSSRYTLEGGRFTLTTPTIRSTAPAGSSSGPLRVSLWASAQGEYQGGLLNGYRLCEFELGRLVGGGVWPPFNLNLEMRRPPSGRYLIVFTLEESGANGYLITHWANYPGTVDF